MNEGEPVNEKYCEQENEDQFRDPEPEGQDFPEGYEDGKFNPRKCVRVGCDKCGVFVKKV